MEPPTFDNVHYRQNHEQQSRWAAAPGHMDQQPNYYPPQPPQQQYYSSFNAPSGGGEFMNSFAASEPMMNVAKAYGEQLAEQGKKKLEKVISFERLRHYFDVDNAYVAKKLSKLLFPFFYVNWSAHSTGYHEQSGPRYDINANDLYIPLMAIITYILMAGLVLGMQDRFTPEQLGLISSSMLAWLLAENVLVLLTKYIISISESLNIWDVLSYSGYKYVGMIISLCAYAAGGQFFYYCALGYASLAVILFLIRSAKCYIIDSASYEEARKRKLYLVLFIALTQPFVMWWLTSSLISYQAKVMHKLPKLPIPDDFPMEEE